MEKKKSPFSIITFVVLITLLQTTISLLPGILFLRDSSQGPAILTYMVLYLIICDFFQVVGKFTYKKGRFVSIPTYAVKVIISCLLIFMIAKNTAFQFSVILIAYELFQLLIFAKQFFYIDSIFYSLTNAFFKGIVFNQLLTISYPFNYHFDLIKPFIFSFAVVLFITVLTQGMYSFLSRHAWFFLLTILSLIALYYLLINQYLAQDISLSKIILFILCTLGTLYFFIRSKNARKKESVLNIFAVLALFIYYL